jgi:bifunctional aspartokinase / homoserine dehydrogenase 1
MAAKKISRKPVVKFGGSNLKRKEDYIKLIRVVKRYDQPMVIVVSALYGVTDILVNTLKRVKSDEFAISDIKERLLVAHRDIVELYIKSSCLGGAVLTEVHNRIEELEKYLRGIHYLGEIPDFVEDRVLSYGERLSSLVLAGILCDNGIACREMLPENLGLYTNGEFRNATVDFNLSEKLVKKYLEADEVFVVPGFYGISPDSRINLLGRGGSDYTAAAVARCIDAPSVDLWKDVPGFMSADPKMVKNASVIQQLSYNEAAELSYFGARIIHPRTFEPVLVKKIPVRLFDIQNFSEDLKPVTIICDQGVMSDDIIKSVTFSDDFGILRLHGAGVGIKPGIMAKVTHKLNENGINIKSIITAQTSINILVAWEDLRPAFKAVESTGFSSLDKLDAIDDITVMAVVGEGILEKPGIAARVFTSVSRHQINIRTISAGASNEAIYFIINKKDNKKAIKAIHREFFEVSEEEYINAGNQNTVLSENRREN